MDRMDSLMFCLFSGGLSLFNINVRSGGFNKAGVKINPPSKESSPLFIGTQFEAFSHGNRRLFCQLYLHGRIFVVHHSNRLRLAGQDVITLIDWTKAFWVKCIEKNSQCRSEEIGVLGRAKSFGTTSILINCLQTRITGTTTE